MLRDVFYYGNKPNVHPREKFAASIEDAREQCTTEHFWIINEYCDYRGFDWDFDFEFLPDEDVWAEKHNNVWPSQHQKDSGTWLCPKKISDTIIYRADVDVVIRKYDKNSNWSSLEFIDESTFDFSWHPDPTDPPYTYVFGTQWQKTGGPVYTVPGIHKKSAVKHVDTRVIRATRLPNKEAFTILDDIVVEDFDYSWHPDDTEEPYIYLFGNNLYPAEVMPTIQYVPKNIVRLSSGKPIGQTKYVNYVKATLGENRTNWKIYQAVDETKFDFCWVPNPKDPAYIYVWGNKYIDGTFSPTIEYHVPSATEKKYMSALVDVLPEWDKWLIPDNIDKTSFDFTWRPDPREPAFIYEFATQWHDRGGPKYIHQSIIRLVSGKPIGQIKYIHDIFAKTSKDKTNWIIPDNIDTTGFDFSWVPHPDDPPYIYQFGTQWQKTGGPKYISDGIVKLSNGKYLGDTKYIDVQQAKTFPDMNGWEVIDDNVITEFDYSWYPDETDEPFIYVFGNNLYPAEIMPTIQYVPKNATRLASGKAIGQVKYVNDIVATLGENYKHWVTPDNIDMDSFDYSWVPNPKDPPYIYEFGTQWQNTGGPVYIVDGATERKYIDIQKAKALPNMDYWEVIDNNVIADFDYSWHPNNTDEPYIYVFGNNQYPAEIMPTIQYVPESIPRLASGKSIGQIKYVNDIIAKLGENRTNWNIPDNIDTTGFDFSWVPPPHDETYIYQFGTQWQKTGGPQYILPSIVKLSTGKYLAPIKYVDIQKVKALPNKNNFEILDNNVIADFDYSWHPDNTDEEFIYVFGNNQYPAEIMPTIQYVPNNSVRLASGAAIGQIKYVNDIIATLGENKKHWDIPDNIDTTSFDFSWVPDPHDDKYVYQFGTQWQKTGGPKYILPSIVKLPTGKYLAPNKYIDIQTVKSLPNKDNWIIPDNIDTTDFDFSWHPDDTDEQYIYQFGTQWQQTGGPRYVAEGATEVKYIDIQKVKSLPNKDNWIIPDNIDTTGFDFSWHPNTEGRFIYQFGTQWQKTGGPKYIIEGATETKYVDIQKVKALPNKNNFEILNDNVIDEFDYSWHHDETDEPYVYMFGNNQYPAEIMPTIQYIPKDAVRLASGKAIGQIKYVNDIVAILGENKSNWVIPNNVDITGFDFSWIPDPHDDKYIYQFGTQWQKTGGPQYILPSIVKLPTGKYLAPVKYIDIQKVKALPNKNNFEILDDNVIVDFDYSWHPDNTDEEFIYVFGNNKYPAEIMPTIQYVPESIPRLASGKPNGQIKYINDIVAILGENKSNWVIPNNIIDFDYSWVPNPKDPLFIYQFGTQWQKTGGPQYILPSIVKLPTGKYLAPVKYIDGSKAKILPNKDNWEIPDNIDTTDFDFSWHPDDTDEPYIYQFGTQWQHTGGPRYLVEGANEVKYIDIQKAKSLPNKDNWIIPDNIDVTDFDFSWHPDALEEPYIYEFGTQWQKTGGPRYLVEGATEVKYVDGSKAKSFANKKNFTILDGIVVADFDYSWQPDDTDEQYIYVFGNNQYSAEIMPTIQYVPESIPRLASGKPIGQIKYVNDIVAILGENKSNWLVPDNVDTSEFDFSWVPHPHDDTYIYQFGTQWQKTDGPKYILPNIVKLSTGKYLAPIKYVDGSKAKILPNENNWVIPDNIIDFDFSWHPDASEEPYIYIFGTQWQKTGGPQYVSPGVPRLASGKPIGQIKYVDTITAKKLPNKKHWTNPNNADVTTFDFSWHPDDTSPPTTYQFGTLLNKEDGPRYVHPGTMDDVVVYLERIELAVAEESIEIKESFPKYIITTTLEDLIEQHPNKLFWALNPNLDYSKFDFDWRPNIEQAQFVQVFGSSENSKTQTYLVNSAMWEKGFREFNWVEEQIKNQIDIFFVDRSNNESHARFEKLKQQFPNIQKTRYLNSWVDTINRCINRANNNLCWILNSELDYTDFNFEYYPNPWQMKMVHVFGTQWSHWGTTFMVNRETFAQDTKHIKIVEHLSNLNFVKDRKAKATNVLYDIVYITHGNVTYTSDKLAITYAGSYLKTFKNMLDKLPVKKEHYIWVCSSICNYKDFDFTYICDPFARDQLHVFPSERQQFGDTFLINVNKLRELIDTMTMMEEYGKINYNQHQRVKRLPAPVIVSEYDTHVASILTEFDFPYATFVTEDNKDMQVIDDEPMNLWSEETKNVIITSTGGTRIIVPKEAKDFVETQLYDYPYITKTAKLAKSNPMDIVFLSNGESCAEENYQHLLKVTEGLPNRVVRVDGINGRVQAYHAVAEASETPWALTVFAKLKVSQKFDWNWQPDRLQMPKHYIFHAKNPVNGLTYGHQAMIAYNKKLTLANEGYGLDFTMDDPNEVVSIISGIATFNTDAYSTWRTAFRECIKLKMSGTTESKERLDMWLTVGMGKFNEYSMEGAQHAVEYYEEVSGDFNKLKLSYEWDWLKEKYKSKYE